MRQITCHDHLGNQVDDYNCDLALKETDIKDCVESERCYDTLQYHHPRSSHDIQIVNRALPPRINSDVTNTGQWRMGDWTSVSEI